MKKKPHISKHVLVAVKDRDKLHEWVYPIFDLTITRSEDQVRMMLPMKITEKIGSPCMVIITYTDDPSNKKAYAHTSLGHTRVRVKMMHASFEGWPDVQVFSCRKKDYERERLVPER